MKRRNRKEKKPVVQEAAPTASLHLEYTIYLKQDYVSDLNEEEWRNAIWSLIDGCGYEKGSDADILWNLSFDELQHIIARSTPDIPLKGDYGDYNSVTTFVLAVMRRRAKLKHEEQIAI